MDNRPPTPTYVTLNHGWYDYFIHRLEEGGYRYYLVVGAQYIFWAFPPWPDAPIVAVVVHADKMEELIGWLLSLGFVSCLGCGRRQVGRHFHIQDCPSGELELVLYVLTETEQLDLAAGREDRDADSPGASMIRGPRGAPGSGSMPWRCFDFARGSLKSRDK
ncbi:hypothetical protein BO86DRAFT_400804 [Aspergillus japonicus CBS 114.51]|uniref:Uncharacterized protein n=1 Tax=Aspergillus japonicus CBS 114.51 TaxID=1448312 RepID=A0A8T8WXG3_ASPJA|nr:hypothetical protein BO86DRAFT_400804 [Aspergillus japonicus CBS 114.51]RAH80501.1 hypothetical protein BO86DRAFT_400804 [Aspergillus japonicus CBS 114.51]